MTEAIKKNALFVASFAVFVGLRIIYRMFGPDIADIYGYFERAMIQTKEQSVSLTDSGVAYAYTGALSELFRFMGNRPEAVWGYQMVLQTAACCLLFFGCCLLFGKAAAGLCVVISAFFPSLIQSLLIPSPANYYLFFFALLFFMVSLFYSITQRTGWYRNNRGELYLMLLGFLSGMLCVWHGFGLCIIIMMTAVVFANKESVAERRKLQQNVWEMEKLLKGQEYYHDEKEEVMTISSQLTVLLAGAFAGGFCTLMKYTGVTGIYLKDQFAWWTSNLLSVKNGLWQEMEPWVFLYLGGVILMSGIFGFFAKKKKGQAKEDVSAAKPEEASRENEKAGQETEDKPKVTYLDNPLPVPKKHEKRTMDFAVDGKTDEFDIQIDEKDDFDV